MSGVHGIDHVNVRASATMIERLRTFYIDIIGLRNGARPAFRSDGYWLYAGDQPVMRLTIGREVTDDEPQPTGKLNHYAFACTGLDATRKRLDAAGIDYEIDEVPDLDQIQLFLRDPAGIGIELNFGNVSQHRR